MRCKLRSATMPEFSIPANSTFERLLVVGSKIHPSASISISRESRFQPPNLRRDGKHFLQTFLQENASLKKRKKRFGHSSRKEYILHGIIPQNCFFPARYDCNDRAGGVLFVSGVFLALVHL